MLYPYALTTFVNALSFLDVYFVFLKITDQCLVLLYDLLLCITFAFVICSHKRDIKLRQTQDVY